MSKRLRDGNSGAIGQMLKKNGYERIFMMDNLWYDLFLAIVSAILGALFGLIIPKFLKDKKEIPEINVDRQLVFSQIHIEQKQYIVNTVGHQKENSNSTNKSQSTSGGEIFFGALIVAVLLVFGFLKYEKEISKVILCAFVFLETTFLTTSYVIVKKYYVDKSIKIILLFNILATIGVPILLYLEKNPITGIVVNKQEILYYAERNGIFSLLLDLDTFGFLLYQAIGIIILVGFLTFTMIGLMHVLSMINLTLNNRFGKTWSWIFRKTLGFCKSVKFYMFFGSLLLVLSFLLVSGVLLMLIIS